MTQPLVIKIGGSTLGEADTTYRDIGALARSGDIPVVVHGGGAEASKWLEAMGIPSRFERGLRVTDETVLPVVVAVFAGLVNKRIVASLNAQGARAVGLCGADGRIIGCRLASPELGFVGDPVMVDATALHALRVAGFVPVVGPIGHVPGTGSDQLVNINADTVAGEVAAAVNARELLFLTDVAGVQGADGEVIPELTLAEARRLIDTGVITGGMIPKVEACVHAALLGVPTRIVDGRMPGALADDASGTRFAPFSD
ncbi:MAG TPA: acetylglutamate kinase [Tepidiformaceae bacterium]|nr:acetylglutamate kinase [Tepidiformaceae bacterium]